MLPIKVVSAHTIEPWDWTAPFTTGIGGSETSHIYMAAELGKIYKSDLYSYAPIPGGKHAGPEFVPWFPTGELNLEEPALVINYRAYELFESPKPPTSKWWFIAQDCDYPWSAESLEKVDRYICLCTEHSKFTLARYPQLKDRVFQSSNGISKSLITTILAENLPRDPNQLIYTSSPDRGLKLLLENWFRIKEAVPEAHLEVFYGFNNMEKIAQLMGGNDWRPQYQAELEGLLKQPGVTFHGRQNQPDLYRHISRSSVWCYPTDWPETSCVTCMEMQALGAWPVTNTYWALGENVQRGYQVEGIPQKSPLVKSLMIQKTIDTLQHPPQLWSRGAMMSWAQGRFDWAQIANQWARWIKEDLQ